MNTELTYPDTKTDASKTAITALNSTVLYVLSYLLLYIGQQLATVAMAHRLSVPLTLYQSRIHFLLADRGWWRTAVIAVYGVGPLLVLLLAIVSALLFWYKGRGRKGRLKLFYFWLTFHGLNLVVGGLIAGCFTHNGFWYVPRWLVVQGGQTLPIVLAVVGGLVAIVFGLLSAVAFLQSHDSRTLMQFQNRGKLIRAGLLVPWVAGSVVLALIKLPDLARYDALIFLTMGLLVLPLAMASRNHLFEETVEIPQKTTVAQGYVVLVLLVVVGWRLALLSGIHWP